MIPYTAVGLVRLSLFFFFLRPAPHSSAAPDLGFAKPKHLSGGRGRFPPTIGRRRNMKQCTYCRGGCSVLQCRWVSGNTGTILVLCAGFNCGVLSRRGRCCGGSEEWKGAVIPPAQQRVMKCDAMRRIAIDAFLKRGMMKSPSNPLTTILPLQINSQTFTSTDFI